uniref:NADH dehydrogenase n=1 Tax=CrAss-like virus sp. ctDAq1 TaxID=2826822 RepID=A0A8S5QT29_9CAUD|nr:MAG TPA: NADH dehydrogenase [CrAss-like virus sp. ctDAq1]
MRSGGTGGKCVIFEVSCGYCGRSSGHVVYL